MVMAKQYGSVDAFSGPWWAIRRASAPRLYVQRLLERYLCLLQPWPGSSPGPGMALTETGRKIFKGKY